MINLLAYLKKIVLNFIVNYFVQIKVKEDADLFLIVQA